MPTVNVQKTRADRTCQKCGATIIKGEQYRSFAKFRQKPVVRCMAAGCTPTDADLTGSDKLVRLYEAREAVQAALDGGGDLDDIKSALEEARDVADEVAEEYREAASHFGDQGPMAEKADNVETWRDELDTAADSIEAFDEDDARAEAETQAIETALGNIDLDDETEEKAQDAIQNGRDAVLVVLAASGTKAAEFEAEFEHALADLVAEARENHQDEINNTVSDALGALEV